MFSSKLSNLNITFSTLFLAVVVIGYPLITSLFLPAVSDVEGVSQTVTIPFRAGVLFLMLYLISINIKKTIRPFPLPLFVLILYWILLVFRMTYDILFRTDVFLLDTTQLWLYVYGICLAGLVTSLKTYNNIDYDKAYMWIWWGLFIVLVLTLFSNQALIGNTDSEYRVDGNIALNTISFGNIGVTATLLTIYMLKEKNLSKIYKILAVILIIISIYSMLRAGSRGPILNFLVVLLFWYFSKRRKLGLGIISLFIVLLIIVFTFDNILSLMGRVSPVIEDRLRETLEGRGGNERNLLYDAAVSAFVERPFIGKQFGIFDGMGGYAYAHNIILDSLMALGIVGGIMMMYILSCALKACYLNIHTNNHYWLSLILLQQMTSLMVSGTFYQDQLFSVLLVIHFSIHKKSFLPWKL